MAQDKPGITILDDQQALDEIFRLSLTESHVYPWLEDMCLDIGHRLSGSPAAEQAVDYSYDLMTGMGLETEKQPVMVPHWGARKGGSCLYQIFWWNQSSSICESLGWLYWHRCGRVNGAYH